MTPLLWLIAFLVGCFVIACVVATVDVMRQQQPGNRCACGFRGGLAADREVRHGGTVHSIHRCQPEREEIR